MEKFSKFENSCSISSEGQKFQEHNIKASNKHYYTVSSSDDFIAQDISNVHVTHLSGLPVTFAPNSPFSSSGIKTPMSGQTGTRGSTVNTFQN